MKGDRKQTGAGRARVLTAVLKIRVRPEERKLLVAEANRRGMNLSSLARHFLRLALGK